jgi:hypothetical protein
MGRISSFLTLYHTLRTMCNVLKYRNMFMLADGQDKHYFIDKKAVILSGYNKRMQSGAVFHN